MKRSIHSSVLILFVAALFSCSTGGKVTKLSDQGMVAFMNEDYAAALETWEPVIQDYEKRERAAEFQFYGKAGQAALNLGDYDKGTGYIEKAIYHKTAEPEDIAALAEAYREIDNLSREIETLELFMERYAESGQAGKIEERLFQTYVESENWLPATELWPQLSESSRGRTEMLAGYFIANRELGNTEVCDELAPQILTVFPENIPALEYQAKKFYNKAEERYQAEMKAYEENQTHKQYARLLKAFETVTEDFQKSLGYFRQLYEIDPGPDYAKYLANIYARLDDKERSEYYRSKSQ
jgi:tetratricopeptide (TPR) repeat protein